MIRDLIDAIAKRLGYMSHGTLEQLLAIYDRREAALGDEIDALKRKITNLTGIIAAADANASATVNDLARKLRIAEKRLALLDEAIRTIGP